MVQPRKLALATAIALGCPLLANASLLDPTINLTISNVQDGPFSDTVDATSGFQWSVGNGTNIGDSFLFASETITIVDATTVEI